MLLGLGLATMFRAVCVGKRCIITAAPPMEEVDGQIYKFDKKCYKMESHAVKCNKNKQIVNI
jgi:hypothetical protein